MRHAPIQVGIAVILSMGLAGLFPPEGLARGGEGGHGGGYHRGSHSSERHSSSSASSHSSASHSGSSHSSPHPSSRGSQHTGSGASPGSGHSSGSSATSHSLSPSDSRRDSSASSSSPHSSSSGSLPRSQSHAASASKSPASLAGGRIKCESCPRNSHGRIKRDSTAVWAFKQNHPKPAGCNACQIDHIIPLSKGRADHPSDIQWLSKEQHLEKTKRDMQGPYVLIGREGSGGSHLEAVAVSFRAALVAMNRRSPVLHRSSTQAAV